MFELKKGKTQFVPVRMFNNTGDGQLGIAYTDITASIVHEDNTIVDLQISASAWFEVSSSVFAGLGTYKLQIHSASITTTGSFMYVVSAGPNVPAVKYVGATKVTTVDRTDVFNQATNISSSMVNISSSIGQELLRLRVVSEGRWKIDPGTNKMTFYTLADPLVPFMVLGLTGSDGVPTTTNPYERRPTS